MRERGWESVRDKESGRVKGIKSEGERWGMRERKRDSENERVREGERPC